VYEGGAEDVLSCLDGIGIWGIGMLSCSSSLWPKTIPPTSLFFSFSNMTDLKLVVSSEDYTTLKVQLVASAVGAPLTIQTSANLTQLDASAKNIVLVTSGGTLTQHIAILRYLAGLNSSANLLGVEDIDRAQVDQWLEFSWQELGKFDKQGVLNAIS
jgi:hypothetical protein